ncbi:MAG: hypothetical protein JO303_13615 [Caulobacteraceae bacterium]|nr:hypothetical protein [Caulobacteraceae bacterium]
MSIDFEPDETEAAVCEALTALCRQHCPEAVARAPGDEFPEALWSAVADFGLFGLAEEGAGGMVALAAGGAVLGEAAAPGPLADAVFAAAALSGAEREAVAAGREVCVLCAPPLAPWPERAGLKLETDGRTVWRLEAAGADAPVSTLSGEPWARQVLRRVEAIGPAERPYAVRDAFMAGYLAGAARRMLRDASAYVATRRQFGKTLAEFQAVSHPLAEAAIRARAALLLARTAGCRIDEGAADAAAEAVVARISAEAAASQAAHACHQAYGAMGMTVDGPVFFVSRRVRQLINQQPAPQAGWSAVEAQYLGKEHLDGERPALAAVMR